jgi:hypothetical protein
MPADNVLNWRPKVGAIAVADPELLWTMHKTKWQIDCALQNCGRNGWSVQLLLDGQTFFRCRFRSWEDAVESAEDKYAELVKSGWTPIPLSADDRSLWSQKQP